MNLNELRKEKRIVLDYAARCRYYRTLVEENLISNHRQGINRESIIPLEKQIQEYSDLERSYENKAAKLEQKIQKSNHVIILCALFAVVLVGFLLFNQTGITGNIVFSTITREADTSGISFNTSTNYTWVPNEKGRLNGMAISGEYRGDGPLRIYLDLKDGSRLIYAAESPSDFESECGNACYLHDNSQEEYIIRVEMQDGGKLKLDSIISMVSKLEEFLLSPKNVTIHLEENRFIRNKFGIYNSRKNNFSVVIYAEGSLTEYLTLNSSFEEFKETDEARYISYDIDLPFDIDSGTYEQRIVVRYVPDGPFKGETPKEVHLIQVNVLGEEKASPFRVNYLHAALIMLVIIMLFNIIFFIKRKA